jgi:hypothetical protein
MLRFLPEEMEVVLMFGLELQIYHRTRRLASAVGEMRVVSNLESARSIIPLRERPRTHISTLSLNGPEAIARC